MKAIKIQIADSYSWVHENVPTFDTPQEMWRWLKPQVTFKHDPDDEELLQTAQTLFDNNQHGMSGMGDCDCFVITVTACCAINGFDCDIVLSGRSPKQAVHIYNYVTDHDGNTYTFDLTQPDFNSERYYPYTQILPVKFSNKITMAKLRLAEPGGYMSLSEGVDDLYVKVPHPNGGFMKVREDYFDDLPDEDWHALMDMVEAYDDSPQMMNGLFSKMRERKQARRDERRQYKLDKITAQADRAAAGGGVGGVLGSVVSGVAGLFGGGGSGSAAGNAASAGASLPMTSLAPAPQTFNPPMQTKGFNIDINSANKPNKTGDWWTDNKKWAIPVGIGTLVLIGSAVYMGHKKKKRKTA